MVEPRFCETLQCFHHIFWDMTLPEGTKKQKSKPSEISVNFGYDKNRPNTDFPIFYIQFCHNFGEHFSNNSGVGFRHSKSKKSKWPSLSRRPYPGRITEEGGTRSHPAAPESIFLINHHRFHAKCKNFPSNFTMCF